MFPYADPTATGILEELGALDFWRQVVRPEHINASRAPGSAFTFLEAFEVLVDGTQPQQATVEWLAFPRTAAATAEEIDANRVLQDEYVEWDSEHDDDGNLLRVTFTTEFRDWYGVLAAVSFETVREAIRRVIPEAEPTVEDIYGPGFDPTFASPGAKYFSFLRNIQLNPWNNGERGILALSGRVNSIPALFALISPCAIPNDQVNPPDVCATLGGACVPGRNSDPFICAQTQLAARGGNGLALADPLGIRVVRLQGQWRHNGQFIDIDDPEEESGAWTVSRNGRRAVLDVTTGVTLDNEPITSGAQVAARLVVGADIVFAPEESLPAFARTGQELLRDT